MAISSLLYSLSRMFLPVWLSFAAVFAFLLQAFQLTIFNYVLPYSYAASYGVLFSVLLLWILARNCFAPKPWHLLAAGLVAGLLALDKVEFGIAAYAGLLWALAIRAARAVVFVFSKRCSSAYPGHPPVRPGVRVADFSEQRGVSFGDDSDPAQLILCAQLRQSLGGKQRLILLTSGLAGLAGNRALRRGRSCGRVVCGGRFRTARWTLAMMAVAMACGHGSVAAENGIFHRPVPAVLKEIAPFVFFNSGMIWLSVVLLALAAKRWLDTRHSLGKSGRPAETSVLLLLPVFAIFVGARIFTKFIPMYYAVFFDTLGFLAWLVAIYELTRLLRLRLNNRIWKGAAVLLCVGIAALTSERYAVHRRPSQIHFARGDI